LVFQCQQCGECCSAMGDVIGIREELPSDRFRIWYKITGETREVSIDPDKRDLFSGQDLGMIRPMACPFLREHAGRYLCTVHKSRPDLCRQYACFRILVLDAAGKRLGRVVASSRYFTTGDPLLRELWDREIQNRSIPDDRLFEEHVDHVLSRAGYRVIR
jgi:uncharacterized protein